MLSVGVISNQRKTFFITDKQHNTANVLHGFPQSPDFPCLKSTRLDLPPISFYSGHELLRQFCPSSHNKSFSYSDILKEYFKPSMIMMLMKKVKVSKLCWKASTRVDPSFPSSCFLCRSYFVKICTRTAASRKGRDLIGFGNLERNLTSASLAFLKSKCENRKMLDISFFWRFR